MIYKVILRHGDVRGYVAQCPAIPGCVSQGRTKREALTNIKEAMLGCLVVLNRRAERDSARHATDEVISVSV